MHEDREGLTCELVFAKTSQEAISKQTLAVNVDPLINPLPTGDHWKVMGWVLEFDKRSSMLLKVPSARRDFIKKASASLGAGRGICFEIVSQAARQFRDSSGLRMQRGKVYAVFKKMSTEILP